MSKLVSDAIALAVRAHAGQVDKAGDPYLCHVARVAYAVCGDKEAEAVAWLHDVMEDSPGYDEQIMCNFPASVSDAVSRLTRWKGHSSEWYYERIRDSPLALKVKLADIADNLDEARLSKLDHKTADRLRRKYAKALELLGQPVDATVTKA